MLRLCALLITSTLMIATPAMAAWQKASNAHFIIYADLTADELQRFAARLERYDAALRQLTKAKDTPPVTIYMVKDFGQVQSLAQSRNVGGFYRGNAQEPFIIAPLSTGRQHSFSLSVEDLLFHEYAHHMLLSNNDQLLPAWTNEGMAEFFMSADVKPDGSIVMGAPNKSRFFSISTMNRWTARRLLLSETERVPGSEIHQRYSRGWLLVHYLFLSGERPNQFTSYVELLNSGVPVAKAAEQAFGDLDQLDSDLQRYVRRQKFKGLQLDADRLKNVLPVAIAPLSEGQAAIMPYRIASANGVTPQAARSLVARARPVAQLYANDAFVQRALAEMEYDAGNLEATVAAADRALAVDPKSVMAMVYKGRVLSRRATEAKTAAAWKEARAVLLQANRADPNHPQPFLTFYDTFIAAGEAPPASAVNGLLRAFVLMPQDRQIHLRVGLMKLRENNLKDARRALSVVAFDPSPSDENAARDAITMLDDGADAKAVLAKLEDKLTILDFAPFQPRNETE